jgi:RNA polymerase sigma-70 factor (ECF subfamily)
MILLFNPFDYFCMMISQVEQNILEDIAESDEMAFEGLFKSYFAELCIYATRFVDDIENAEEIVQDIFFNLWNNRTKLTINSSIKAYLYTTVRNTCLNIIKHKKVENKYREHFSRQLQQDELREEDWMKGDELHDKITLAIEKLPPERKKVFMMSRFDNLKYKEIAEELNISIKTVENQMGKALQFLREELKDYLPLLIFLFNEWGKN